ncbi:hypothetical protein AB0I22_33715 [Streptomyces sp. NPDC050610]|uniref:hypothetical protein n=1 Tax=Streptomyces sp. NPDC050610 TaxID=3157097 RepID=UPI00342603CA
MKLAVPRRAGHGQGLEQRHAQLFTDGLEQVRRHVEWFGHSAIAHTASGVREGSIRVGGWPTGVPTRRH